MISFETSKCPLNNSNIATVMDPMPNLESPHHSRAQEWACKEASWSKTLKKMIILAIGTCCLASEYNESNCWFVTLCTDYWVLTPTITATNSTLDSTAMALWDTSSFVDESNTIIVPYANLYLVNDDPNLDRNVVVSVRSFWSLPSLHVVLVFLRFDSGAS